MKYLVADRTAIFLLATLWLCALLTLLFHNHLLGAATFPWDFQGGYFTYAVARMRDGSFVAPPLWLPWGGFGIPAHLSLQDGTWYLPQWLFDFFGWTYDLVGATRLQIAHVAGAGVGTWLLSRHLGCSYWSSTLAATAAIFSGSFFSNAQHVDIVRGAALFPWLLLSVSLCLRKGSPLFAVICGFVAWQFLMGAYPGQVIAAAYCLCVPVVVIKCNLPNRVAKLRALGWLAVAAILAVALAAVKFLPVALDVSNIRQTADQLSQVDAGILTTLLFNFDAPYLSNDVTMRDLFLPLSVLLLAPFGLMLGVAGRVGLALIAVAAFFILDPVGLASAFPLFNLSRFHLADFRPMLHLGFLLCAAKGMDAVFQSPITRWQWGAFIIGVALLVQLFLHGISIGVSEEIAEKVSWVAIATLFCIAAAQTSRVIHLRNMLMASIIVLAAWSGFEHEKQDRRVWDTPRSDAREIQLFGATIRELASINRFDALTSRPRRIILEPLPLNRGQMYDERYNRGWLSEKFSAFGYSDLKGSRTFQYFYDGASSPDSSIHRQIEWLVAPSQLIIGNGSLDVLLESRQHCEAQVCDIFGSKDPRIKPLRFLENGEEWQVDTLQPLRVVQNEVWYRGWTSVLCRENNKCAPGPEAQDFHGMRSWLLPTGTYRMISYYRPPGWELARTITIAGAWGIAFLLALHLLFNSKSMSMQSIRNISQLWSIRMRKPLRVVGIVSLIANLIVVTACQQKPGEAAITAPSTAASPDFAKLSTPSFAILAAQIGNQIDTQGYLVESKSDVATTDPLYGLAAFRGNGPAQARVAISITDSVGSEIYSEEKTFTLGGDVRVMFTIRSPDADQLPAGDYKATFICDGGPCWEINFKVKS